MCSLVGYPIDREGEISCDDLSEFPSDRIYRADEISRAQYTIGILSTLLQDLFVKKFSAKRNELFSLEMTSRVLIDGSKMCISNIQSA